MEYPRFTGREPCRSTDPEAFYPEVFSPEHDRAIREICEWCPMREPCADWGIRHETHGYWGGLSPADRRKIRRKRGRPLQSDELRQSAA